MPKTTTSHKAFRDWATKKGIGYLNSSTTELVKAAYMAGWAAQAEPASTQSTDICIVDYLASYWESQWDTKRRGRQAIMAGQCIDNPTGSFRDAVLANMRENGPGNLVTKGRGIGGNGGAAGRRPGGKKRVYGEWE